MCLVAAAWTAVILWPGASRALGFGEVGEFFDLRGSLAAGEAGARGMDPYAINRLDPFGRPHLYSSWWLMSGTVGLARADTAWLGAAILACALVAAVVACTPRGWPELSFAGAILVSPAWLLAAYRANNDLIVFIGLATVLFAFPRTGKIGRTLSAGLIGVLAVLKFFPAAALLAALGAHRRREMLLLLGAAAGIILLGWPSVAPALVAAAKYRPETTGLTAFGATVLAGAEADMPRLAGWLLAAAAGAIGFHGLARGFTERPSGVTQGGETRAMAAAVVAAVATLCFAIGSSYSYKLIFLWWLMPWLWRDAPAVLGRRRAGLLIALLLAEYWVDGLVLTLNNVCAPSWSLPQRRSALTFLRATAFVTQLGCWVLMGACGGLALTWARQQLSRLARTS